LTVGKVFENFNRIMLIEGKGAVDKKLGLVIELLGQADEVEARYIVRTLLGDLRIGTAEGVLRDSISKAFFGDDKGMRNVVQRAYDLSNDFAVVFESAKKGKKSLEKIDIHPGRPMNVMLPVKVDEVEEGFRICGKPAAFEHKYDGFRVLINKDENGKVSLFTRRLENVTNQFPDVVSAVEKYVQGKSFILDSEVVGYHKETKKYTPFEAISQRIKRKYGIKELVEKLPVEINVFDIMYLNGKSLFDEPFTRRRKIIEKIVKHKAFKIRISEQIVTDDIKVAKKFYKNALKIGEEGVMIKKIDAKYHPGRRVGYIVKIKPSAKDLDLVIVGAEYGTGKRAGWLTSYIVACEKDGKFVEVGKVASGLKEKPSEGMSYGEMTDILKKIVIGEEGIRVKVKPKTIVSVTYQNIQKSPSYSSGFAMRFPRITAYRPDRNTSDIATVKDIEREARKGR